MRYFVLIFLWLVTSGISAQNVNMTKHRFRLSKKDFVDTIPITIDRLQQILIPVDIAGETRYFKLDTGAGFGTVYEGDHIKPQRVLGTVKSVDGAGVQKQVKAVVLPPFTIGSVQVSDYVMTEAPASVLSNHFGHDAVIGFALFGQGLSAKIDCANRQLILTDRKRFFDKEQGEVMKYRVFHFAPYLYVAPVPGVRLNTLFDTGCRDFFLLSKRDFDLSEPYYASSVSERVQGRVAIANHGVEPSDEVVFLQLKALRIGKLSLTDVATRTHQGASCIGREFLQYGSLIIKSPRKQFVFQPYTEGSCIAIGNEMADLYYVPQDNRPSVGLIRSTSPLYQAGLRQGDIILRIDSKAVDFRSYMTFPWVKDKRYILSVQDTTGVMREVEIVR